MVSSSVSSRGKVAPHSQLPMMALVVFPPTFRVTRETLGLYSEGLFLAGLGVGAGFGGGASARAGPSAFPRLSPSVFIAARERTIETRERRVVASRSTTKSKVLPQLGQLT